MSSFSSHSVLIFQSCLSTTLFILNQLQREQLVAYYSLRIGMHRQNYWPKNMFSFSFLSVNVPLVHEDAPEFDIQDGKILLSMFPLLPMLTSLPLQEGSAGL